MKEEWLMAGSVVPVDVETTAALVAEIHRLIGVVGNMALAQALQEPVAWEQFYPDIGKPEIAFNAEVVGYVAPQLTWVGLTDEDIDGLHSKIKVRLMGTFDTKDIYRAIEAKLKEKNHDT